MSLTDWQIVGFYESCDEGQEWGELAIAVGRAIESATAAPLLERIKELEANEKVLLAQVQGHTKWREKILKASEEAYGESSVRYKFSLTKHGKCMNTFPREIDGRWFALTPAEDDGHIGHIARIAELEQQLEAARKDADRLDYLDKLNARLNAFYGTTYRWSLVLSPNIVRLMSGRHANGHVGDIDLHDSDPNGAESCRAAIDAAISKEQE